jgi:hypothetical protein
MGGLGSGNYYRFGKKDRAEACRSLDVRRWQREGLLVPGQSFRWAWYRDGREVSSIGVTVLRGAVELSYFVGSENRKEDMHYTVPFSWTPCNFGGKRRWFVCPGVVYGRYCGRRVAKLYLKQRYFLCRHCHSLTYGSQQESHRDRALRRARNIRRRLGGSANMTQPFPDKPKGMHWRTYCRLFLEYKRANEEYTRAMNAEIRRLTGRVFHGLGDDP